MNFTTLVLFATTLYVFQNLVRYAKSADWNGVSGIVLSVAAGIGAVLLAAHSDAVGGLHPIQGAPALNLLDGAAQVMLGIAVGTTAPVVADLRKAFDSSDSAKTPKLVGPTE